MVMKAKHFELTLDLDASLASEVPHETRLPELLQTVTRTMGKVFEGGTVFPAELMVMSPLV